MILHSLKRFSEKKQVKTFELTKPVFKHHKKKKNKKALELKALIVKHKTLKN